MKLALNSQLQTYQLLTNGDQMLIWLILYLSYFITTVSVDDAYQQFPFQMKINQITGQYLLGLECIYVCHTYEFRVH